MRARDHNRFSAVDDVGEREQIAATEMEEQRPNLQADAIGERSAARPVDDARAQDDELEAFLALRVA